MDPRNSGVEDYGESEKTSVHLRFAGWVGFRSSGGPEQGSPGHAPPPGAVERMVGGVGRKGGCQVLVGALQIVVGH